VAVKIRHSGCAFYLTGMTHTITAIETQARNSQRVNIYLDGSFAFGLAKMTAAWLKVNQELSDEKIAQLQKEDEGEAAFQKALHFIDYRPRSTDEVRKNLIKHKCPEGLVEETLERLKRSGLVNDDAFARAWVENRNTFRPRGKAVLRMELRRKGLSDDVIQSVLDEQKDEEALCLAAAKKQSRRLVGLEFVDFRSKLAGHLGRRGFSYDVISPVVSQIWLEIQMADSGGNSEK
jgi:regulatory protein